MMELCVGRQKIRFDREATVTLYRNTIIVPGADECTCTSCKNFATQRTKIYPEEFLRILSELGVDPLKEWEAFDYYGDRNMPNHLYGGWFLFAGELIEGLNEWPPSEQAAFSYWFTTNFPPGTLPKEPRVCALEFLTQIPWVIGVQK